MSNYSSEITDIMSNSGQLVDCDSFTWGLKWHGVFSCYLSCCTPGFVITPSNSTLSSSPERNRHRHHTTIKESLGDDDNEEEETKVARDLAARITGCLASLSRHWNTHRTLTASHHTGFFFPAVASPHLWTSLVWKDGHWFPWTQIKTFHHLTWRRFTSYKLVVSHPSYFPSKSL